MFIEYEIEEEGEIYCSIVNVDHLIVIEGTEDEVVVFMTSDTVRFYLVEPKNLLLYDAFKRALCGESVIIEGIGYVRPLNAKTPSMGPITHMTWRNFP